MAINIPPIEQNFEGDDVHRDEHIQNYINTGKLTENLGHGSKCNYCLDSMTEDAERNFKASGSRLSNFHTSILNAKLNLLHGREI